MKKNNILTIAKKEFRRFFGDRRMVVSILMPGILIYVIYSLMGSSLMKNLTDNDKPLVIQAEYLPPFMEEALTGENATSSPIRWVNDYDDPKTAIAAGDLDAYIVFPDDFENKIAAYDPTNGDPTTDNPAPSVDIFYNSSSTSSQTAYSLLVGILDTYESTLANRMDINPSSDTAYDLAAPEDVTGMIFSMLMPMLLVTLMFSGCMAMTTESIAGEKERGTVATLLVTPLKRSELAAGKILALSCISLLAGLCSFVGVLLALPKLMGAEGATSDMVDASVYGVTDYLVLLPIIISTVLVFVSVISIISAYARSVKEATGMVSPLMFVVVIIGVSGMFISGERALWQFLFPVYNSVACISNVFSMDYSPAEILVTTATNLLAAGACVVLLARMFRSEKVMFKK